MAPSGCSTSSRMSGDLHDAVDDLQMQRLGDRPGAFGAGRNAPSRESSSGADDTRVWFPHTCVGCKPIVERGSSDRRRTTLVATGARHRARCMFNVRVDALSGSITSRQRCSVVPCGARDVAECRRAVVPRVRACRRRTVAGGGELTFSARRRG